MLPAIGLDGRYLDAHHPGIGRYIYELARHLPDVLGGRALHLVVNDRENARFDLMEAAERGVRLARIGGAPRGVSGPLRLRRTARQFALDLWHAPYYPTSFGPSCPVVLTVYDTIGVLDKTFLPSPWRRLVYRLTMAAALGRARRVITLSEAAKRDLQKHFGVAEERITVTHAGVSEAFRPAAPAAIAPLRAALGLPRDYLLFVGTDRPHKNLDRLVAAWQELAATGRTQGWSLVLAGFPRRGQRARPDGGGLVHLGAVAEASLPALIAGAKLFVLPSLAEGFGLPILEAMACGTAVACARAGSMVEVAGEAAATFEPKDTSSIVETLERLIRHPDQRHALAVAGLARARRFTWQTTARATVAVYDQALAS